MKKVLYILMLFAFSIDVTAQYTVVRRNSKTAQPSKTITPNSKSARNTSTPSKHKTRKVPDHAVDLGLPSGTLWADRNLGASSESDYGNYFAYGDITPEKYIGDSDEKNYPNKNIVRTKMDAATHYWGGRWHMPTRAQAKELVRSCKWKETKIGNKFGYRITGPNGNSIFLPSAGFMMFGRGQTTPDYCDQGSRGDYRCGEVNLKETEGNAYEIYFATAGHSWHYVTEGWKWDYCPIRPVWN